MLLMLYLRTVCLSKSHKNVLYFTLKAFVFYLSHLDCNLNWCEMGGKGVGGQHSFFFSLQISYWPSTMIENIIISPLHCGGMLVINQVPVCVCVYVCLCIFILFITTTLCKS